MRFELLYLPGLLDVVAAEAVARLGTTVFPVREDSVQLEFPGRWERLNSLRTPVAAFAVLPFRVRGPRSLLSGDHLPVIVAGVKRVRGLGAASFRIEAAGADSAVYQKIGYQISSATRLRFAPHDGDIVLRFRPSVTVDGWDVLIRLSPRPLSHRQWRVRNMPGAVNATVAAAMAVVSEPRPGDRVANPMCGSGTLMIERLLAAPAASCFGLDSNAQALSACTENLAAAGLTDRTTLLQGDATAPDWTRHGPFDVMLAAPPWGGLLGDHRTNEALHLALLHRAHQAAAPGARLVVLTHEIRRMERCLRATAELWKVDSVTRVFQKGHHPRIYLLRGATG